MHQENVLGCPDHYQCQTKGPQYSFVRPGSQALTPSPLLCVLHEVSDANAWSPAQTGASKWSLSESLKGILP